MPCRDPTENLRLDLDPSLDRASLVHIISFQVVFWALIFEWFSCWAKKNPLAMIVDSGLWVCHLSFVSCGGAQPCRLTVPCRLGSQLSRGMDLIPDLMASKCTRCPAPWPMVFVGHRNGRVVWWDGAVGSRRTAGLMSKAILMLMSVTCLVYID